MFCSEGKVTCKYPSKGVSFNAWSYHWGSSRFTQGISFEVGSPCLPTLNHNLWHSALMRPHTNWWLLSQNLPLKCRGLQNAWLVDIFTSLHQRNSFKWKVWRSRLLEVIYQVLVFQDDPSDGCPCLLLANAFFGISPAITAWISRKTDRIEPF